MSLVMNRKEDFRKDCITDRRHGHGSVGTQIINQSKEYVLLENPISQERMMDVSKSGGTPDKDDFKNGEKAD